MTSVVDKPISPTGRLAIPIARVLVQNFVFCTVIALILWLLVPSIGQYGFYNNFVHAQAIGNSICLLAIATTRLAISLDISDRWITTVSILLVTPLGIYVGMAMASWWLDLPGGPFTIMDQDQLIASVVTAVVASFAFSWHLANKQKVLRLELEASEQRRRADNARHAMLRAQLEPHMLFNTLANLRALIAIDTARATDMLDRLDSFLRETLSSSQSLNNSLQHEFKILDDYLALMGVRLGERLSYKLQLPDNCKNLPVPSLILQPLVENAIRHGLEPQIDGGEITVSASRQNGRLTLLVADTGCGMSHSDIAVTTTRQVSSARDGGFGLINIRERLAELFRDEASMHIESADPDSSTSGTGTRIRITLPIARNEL